MRLRYGVYFHTSHVTELALIAEVGANAIRITTRGLDYENKHKSFFQLVDEHKLSVLFSFSFARYNLMEATSPVKWRQVLREIKQDIEDLVKAHEDQSSIKAWVLGDFGDDILDSPDATTQAYALSLLEETRDTFRKLDDTRQVAVSHSDPEVMTKISERISGRFDFVVLDVQEKADGENVKEVYLSCLLHIVAPSL